MSISIEGKRRSQRNITISDDLKRAFRNIDTSQDCLYINARFMTSIKNQEYFFTNIPMNIQILRISTPLIQDIEINELNILINVLISHEIWGLNLGEAMLTDESWNLFIEFLQKPECKIGFLFIHDSLQYLKEQIQPLLRLNRKKKINGIQPWYDSENIVFKHELSTKFWWNPYQSKYYL